MAGDSGSLLGAKQMLDAEFWRGIVGQVNEWFILMTLKVKEPIKGAHYPLCRLYTYAWITILYRNSAMFMSYNSAK